MDPWTWIFVACVTADSCQELPLAPEVTYQPGRQDFTLSDGRQVMLEMHSWWWYVDDAVPDEIGYDLRFYVRDESGRDPLASYDVQPRRSPAVPDVTELPHTTSPEPATLVLLGSGLAGLGAAARRRRSRGTTGPGA